MAEQPMFFLPSQTPVLFLNLQPILSSSLIPSWFNETRSSCPLCLPNMEHTVPLSYPHIPVLKLVTRSTLSRISKSQINLCVQIPWISLMLSQHTFEKRLFLTGFPPYCRKDWWFDLSCLHCSAYTNRDESTRARKTEENSQAAEVNTFTFSGSVQIIPH